MLQVKGRNTSSNVMKVLWTLDELGLDFEREDIGGPFGKNKDTAYLALNPNGLIPTLVDGDLVLWESNAIVRWLTSVHSADAMYPTDPAVRARCDMWMDWQLTILNGLMVHVFHPLIRLSEAERDPVAVSAAVENWGNAWAILDDHLSRNTYVGGDKFTMADIPMGPLAYRWYELPIERRDLPNLKRWYDLMCDRPAYRENVMRGLS